ncbi:MAG: NAD(P)/FAD-dependent oxidoreductase [Chlorobi bacterium]|nr:NAD(P)/FAD-dependent oxidoreductase [Chlorobiota bacterium]
MHDNTTYDITVIGSGPAGFAAVNRALDYGMNICLVEEKNIGGTGVVNGVLTSKTMYELSMDYAIAARIDRGYRAGTLAVNYNEVKKTIIQAAKEKQYQMLSQIETFAPGKKNKKGSVTLKKGRASFIDTNTIKITSPDSKEEIVNSKNFIVATGSKPRKYPGLEIDGKRVITSDHILSLDKFPERMLIVGSGIIGCEFATIFSNFRQTEVHLLDRAHRVIPYEDDDVSDFVSDNLEMNGVIIHHTASLREIRKQPDHLEIILDYDNGYSKVFEVDVVLIAIGRELNTKNLGLENIGITTNKRGVIKINKDCLLENDKGICNIFAAGDITGHYQLFSVAEHQGRLAVEKIAGNEWFAPDYSHLSTLMFFKPEVAAVGANEKILREKKTPYKVAYYSNKLVNRAIAMRNTGGFVKILVSNDDEQRLLGMRAAGPQASSLIVAAAHLISKGISLKDALNIFYPHPSLPEGIQECMRLLHNSSVYKPEAFPDYIYIREWQP